MLTISVDTIVRPYRLNQQPPRMALQELVQKWRAVLARRAQEDLDLAAAAQKDDSDFEASKRLSLTTLREHAAKQREKLDRQAPTEMEALKKRQVEELAALIKQHESQIVELENTQRGKEVEHACGLSVSEQALDFTLAQEKKKMLKGRGDKRTELANTRDNEDRRVREEVMPTFFSEASASPPATTKSSISTRSKTTKRQTSSMDFNNLTVAQDQYEAPSSSRRSSKRQRSTPPPGYLTPESEAEARSAQLSHIGFLDNVPEYKVATNI